MFELSLKEEVHKACIEKIQSQLDLLQRAIAQAKESLTSESKSSAGDKHETGRAMAQLELEKLGGQFESARKLFQLAERLPYRKKNSSIQSGSLVLTESFVYYISIGLGKTKLKFEGKDIYTISPASPLAQNILGLKKGDEYGLNGQETKILDCI